MSEIWQYTPYTISLLVVSAITIFLTVVTWRHRGVPGAKPFALLMGAVTIFALAYLLEITSVKYETKLFWTRIQYLGIATTPFAWLIFSFIYTGRSHWLSPRNIFLLAILPLLTIVMVWTDQYHHIYYTNTNIDDSLGFPLLQVFYGPWAWVNIAWSYVYIMLGEILLIIFIIRLPKAYRGQIVAVIISALLPWAGNILYVFRLNPFPLLDLTPFAFAGSGIAISWGIFRYRLLDIIPVAREAIVENLSDGIIVLNTQDRVVDLNPAAERLVDWRAKEAIGRPAQEVLKSLTGLPEHLATSTETHMEFRLEKDAVLHNFDLNITYLRDKRNRISGRLVLLHDISERLQARDAIRQERTVSAKRSTQLEAAALVAREAAGQHDLGELLFRTANMITENFGFYHTGIFLIDDKREFAVLQTASSEGGRRMLERGHRLEVGRQGIVGNAAYLNRPHVAMDVGRDAVFFNNPDLPLTRSEAAIPLSAGGKVIGVLDIQSTEQEAFNQDDIEVLHILADQVALAIQNARLLTESQNMLHQLEAAISDTVHQNWNERTQQQKRFYRYSSSGIVTLSAPDGGSAAQNTPSELRGNHLRIPITLRGKKIGAITLHRKGESSWQDADRTLAMEIAGQVGLALENSRLLEEAQLRAHHEQAISELTSHLGRYQDPDTLLQAAVRELHQLTNVEEVSVFIAPPVTPSLTPQEDSG